VRCRLTGVREKLELVNARYVREREIAETLGLRGAAPIEAYWTWKERHTSHDLLPNGESVDEALLRYAGALERLLGRDEVGLKAAATTAAPAFAGRNV
jgi:hypothetical protein